MSIFEDFEIDWRGKTYKVPANRVMGLVEVVEDSITIEELSGPGIKRAKLAKAFCAMLAYAGCRESQETVYNVFFSPGAGVEQVAIVNALLTLMIPPEHLRANLEDASAEDEAKKKEVDS